MRGAKLNFKKQVRIQKLNCFCLFILFQMMTWNMFGFHVSKRGERGTHTNFCPCPRTYHSIIWEHVAHVWLRASGQHFWLVKKYFAAPKIFIIFITRNRVHRIDPVSRGPMKTQLQIYINLILSVWPCFPLHYLATCTFGPLSWYHAIIYQCMMSMMMVVTSHIVPSIII